jgi:hypothetical protein
VQVCTIFRVSSRTPHALNNIPLLYVRWFERPALNPVKDINMFRIKREMTSARRTCTSIIPLSLVHRFIQLVPDFGPNIAPELASTTSAYRTMAYWVNSFADKEIYQAIW